ncbi:hypothetical protein NL463_28860, partial [Klebsiella pneumoniae]|nr:hypothetical protein [Klebsiella pneumoniae]
MTDRAGRDAKARATARSGSAAKRRASARLGAPITPALSAAVETAPEAVDPATLTEIFRRFHAAEPEPKGE